MSALLVVIERAWPAHAAEADDIELHIPVGCFQYGYKYHPAMQNISGMPYHVDSVFACQVKCRMVEGCYHFSYWQKTRECWLADISAQIIRAPTEGSVAGAGTCAEETPACTAIPGPSFPGNTEEKSRLAWLGGQQPTNLQCWPRMLNGFPNKCHTRMATVVEDTAAGWPGRCSNLRKVTDLQPGETCQLRCFNSALCGVWAIENVTQMGVVTCWQAMNGMNCTSGSAFKPIRAQRVMHGSFRVLMNTMAMQIMNLTKAFDIKDVGSAKEGVKRCRKTCLSYLLCQFWQYSNVWGCWLEDPSVRRVAYPLVNNGVDMLTEVETSNTVKAGEYIQHFCADGDEVALPTDAPGSMGAAVQSGGVAIAGNSQEHVHLELTVAPTVVPSVTIAAPIPTAQPLPQGPGARKQNRAGAAPDLGQAGRAGHGGGMPSWASFLIGVTMALALVAVGLGVWMTLMDSEKKGAKGSKKGKYSRPGSSRQMSSYSSGYTDSASSFAESQPMMSGQSSHQQGSAPPTSHHGLGDWFHAATHHNLSSVQTQHFGNVPTQQFGGHPGYGYGHGGYGHR